MDVVIVERIGRRRRQVIVHACLYYRLNANILSDHTYDIWAKELATLQEKYVEEAKAAPLAEEFKDFGGETTSGFMLPIHDPTIIGKAQRLLKLHEGYKKALKKDGLF